MSVNMSHKVICLFLLLLINNLTFSYDNKYELQNSGPFYLEGGVIQPKNLFSLDFDQLPSVGYAYKVTCDIENPNYFKDYPVVIWAAGTFEGTINQKSSSSKQYLLNKLVNKFEAISRQSIAFINLDDSDPVYVTNWGVTIIGTKRYSKKM